MLLTMIFMILIGSVVIYVVAIENSVEASSFKPVPEKQYEKDVYWRETSFCQLTITLMIFFSESANK